MTNVTAGIFVHEVHSSLSGFCLCLYTICRHRRTCRRPQLRPPSYCGRGSARPGGVPCLPCLPCFEEQRPIAAGARPTSRCDCPCTRLVAKRRRGEGWGRHEPRRSKQGGAGGAGGPGGADRPATAPSELVQPRSVASDPATPGPAARGFPRLPHQSTQGERAYGRQGESEG